MPLSTPQEACQVLGVSMSADKADIKKVYRFLSLAYHPDRAPKQFRDMAEERMKAINEAYRILAKSGFRTLPRPERPTSRPSKEEPYAEPASSFALLRRRLDALCRTVAGDISICKLMVFDGKKFTQEYELPVNTQVFHEVIYEFADWLKLEHGVKLKAAVEYHSDRLKIVWPYHCYGEHFYYEGYEFGSPRMCEEFRYFLRI